MAERFTRQALYDLVWSEPMKTLAARFGISDVALKKSCEKADIPTPERGYWAKKDAGKHVEQAYLPERSPGMADEIRIAHGRRTWWEVERDERAEPLPQAPEFTAPLTVMQARLEESIGKIVVPREARSWQPALERLLANDEKRREKQRASPYPSSWDDPLFDTPFERRRLRILNSLGFALARVNGHLYVGNDGRNVGFAIHRQHVSISLDRHVPKPRRSSFASVSAKQVGDRLRLAILKGGVSEEVRASWSDDDTGKLESRLAEIAVQIGLTAEVDYRDHVVDNYEWRVKRKAQLEEEERKRKLEAERQERERQEKLEQARIDRLLKDARAFEQAGLIRSYVASIQAGDPNRENAHAEHLQRWIEWALAQAERIDPAVSGRYLVAMQDEEGS